MTDTEILHAEAADRIRAAMGVTADDPALRRRRDIRNAAETASHCATCAREIAPGEPIWRVRMDLGRSWLGWSTVLAPQCEECVWTGRGFRPAKPCESCGRPVHNERDGNIRRHTYCSETCSRRMAPARARERRAEARGRTRACLMCSEHFEPARADARFCSGVCKQRACRRRVTDSKLAAADEITSRNGGAA